MPRSLRVCLVTLDHEGETALYLQLAGVLRDRIRSGDLAIGRPLPSLPTLMQTYDVSRGTAHRAVRLLIEEGTARTAPGRGVFVIARPR
jgi:DNA-binding GntR family transcriptional regulator